MCLAFLNINSHLDINIVPSAGELKNTYIFRYTLACYILALDWFMLGGLNNVKYEKLRNDLIDMSYITFSTFFDGLLSLDNKLLRIERDVKLFLERVFV